MTKLPYTFWCYHLTEVEGIKWREVDYRARILVKGLKREDFGGYFDAKIGGKSKRFDKSNVEELVDFVLPQIGRRFQEDIKGPISIVPIPNSGMAVGVKDNFRAVELAEKMAAGYGREATVVPAIRWDEPRKKQHKSKDFRHPGLFEPHMRLVEKPASPVVLFDDVLTSGSQMIAAARMLVKSGFAPSCGLVVARATKLHEDEHFLSKRTDVLDLADNPFNLDEF